MTSEAHQKSFRWIWDTQSSKLELVGWLRSDSPIFWLSGKPGAGKSTLMKYLVESEKITKFLSKKSDATIVVHYFFHELGEPKEKSFGGLLHAIVYQLLIGFHRKNQAALSRLYKLLKPHLDWNLTSKAAVPDQVLMKVLQKLIAECKETLRLRLFIDGLDECHGDHRMQLDFLVVWVRSSSDKKLSIKACIASRVEPEIKLRLSDEPTFSIHQFTRKDTLVVSQLVVAIEEEAEADDLSGLLAELPEGLEKLYASIINKIDQRFWPDTINIFRIFQALSSWNLRKRGSSLLKLSAAILDPISAIRYKAYSEEGFTLDDVGLSHTQCARG